MHVLDVLKARGFINQCTDEDALRRLCDEGPITFYAGFDPTGPSLHAGHLLPLMGMSWLSRAGHTAIGVVGGGTAMVGDPSGKDQTRDMLDADRLNANKLTMGAQVRRYCQGQIVDNAEWLLGLNYIEFLRDIGSQFSVNRMLSAEGTRLRLERGQGMSFIEFNYVLLQSYDFLELNRRYGCRLQVGGGDQWFNIVSGIDLIRRMEGVEAYGLTQPLLTTSTGAKMGKTASGAVWLDAGLMSPYDYYQYWVNVDDRDVERFTLLYTYDEPDLADIRAAKRRLAHAATAIAHGQAEADKAQEAALAAFSGGVSDQMPTWHNVLPVKVVDALVGSGLAKSKSEARRLIEQGGISVGDKKVTQLDADIDAECVLWAGKKRAVRVQPTP